MLLFSSPPKRTPGGLAGSHYTDLLLHCHAGPLRVRGQARHPAAGASWLRVTRQWPRYNA